MLIAIWINGIALAACHLHKYAHSLKSFSLFRAARPFANCFPLLCNFFHFFNGQMEFIKKMVKGKPNAARPFYITFKTLSLAISVYLVASCSSSCRLSLFILSRLAHFFFSMCRLGFARKGRCGSYSNSKSGFHHIAQEFYCACVYLVLKRCSLQFRATANHMQMHCDFYFCCCCNFYLLVFFFIVIVLE